ncbi:MAG: diguanylate cyclase [Aliarcobacter sp.]|nr:diguanylate cyclase [Aliarcobacter sp.]
MKKLVVLSIFGVMYYLVAIYGMVIFSFQPSNITLLWLPFALAVVFVHHFGIKSLPFIFMGSFFANFSGMNNGDLSLTIIYTSISATADTIAPYLSSLLLKRFVDDKFDSIKGFLPFILYGVVIPTFVSSVIISINLFIGNYISSEKILSYIILLMFADGLGLFLIYPIYKYFSKSPLSFDEIKTVLVFAVIIFPTVYLSFHYHFLVFLLPTIILLFAFRMRGDIVAFTLLLVVMELIALSARNENIFYDKNNEESLLMLMSFISSLVIVVIGITQHQRDLLKHQIGSLTDALTQTKNRLSYKEIIEKQIDYFNQTQIPFSILLFDIDDFKLVNDTYSHRVGDIVLVELSSLIQENIRNSDSLFRMGGEEFVVLFPNTSLKIAVEIAEKLRTLVEKNIHTLTEKAITISIGITQISENDTEDSLYRRVDKLLYVSKRTGKNKITSDLEE